MKTFINPLYNYTIFKDFKDKFKLDEDLKTKEISKGQVITKVVWIAEILCVYKNQSTFMQNINFAKF